MRIDKNVTVEDVKKRTKESLEMLDQKYISEDSIELQNGNSNNVEPESTSRRIRIGWK